MCLGEKGRSSLRRESHLHRQTSICFRNAKGRARIPESNDRKQSGHALGSEATGQAEAVREPTSSPSTREGCLEEVAPLPRLHSQHHCGAAGSCKPLQPSWTGAGGGEGRECTVGEKVRRRFIPRNHPTSKPPILHNFKPPSIAPCLCQQLAA